MTNTKHQTHKWETNKKRFIREGKLTKICRKHDKEYVFILFSDLLMYGDETNEKKLKLHRQIPIDQNFRTRNIPQNPKYGTKCFEIHSPMKSFIVFASHPKEKREWLDEFEKVSADKNTIKSKYARAAPLWVPDDFSDVCTMPNCVKSFGILNRRHHCRFWFDI